MKRNMITGMPMKEDISKARSLSNINVAEVSLVDKPATKLKFLFFKSDDGDELDMLLSVLEQANFDKESDIAITKALGILVEMSTEQREAIAKTIMAVLKLANVDIGSETEGVRKIDSGSLKWPSLQQGFKVEKTEPEVTDETKWPSLA